jgi:hypothetical protein
MEAIIKVISFFIALLAIVNGAYVVYMPPAGDEMMGFTIMAIGILLFAGILWYSRMQEAQR